MYLISIKTEAAKSGLSISVLCTDFPVDYTISVYMMTILHFYCLNTRRYIYIAALQFLINWNEKRCSKCNILTMDHELVIEDSSSAAVYTLSVTEYYYLFEGHKVFEYQIC